jgi:hypothetical protein
MSKFSDLQATHEQLVNRAQSSEDILDQVQQYLKDIQSGSSQVSSARERDQLRANLRYWAGYVYEKTKEYPNVDLLPAAMVSPRRTIFSLAGGILLLVLFFALGIVSNILSSGTSFFQTESVDVITYTPVKPLATFVSDRAGFVTILNSALRSSADPLGEVLDARFTILDVGFGMSEASTRNIMQIRVECNAIFTPSTCSPERAFVVLTHVLENENIRKMMIQQMPSRIDVLQVRASDRFNEIGTIEISWADFLAFANGTLTAEQLAGRIERYVP